MRVPELDLVIAGHIAIDVNVFPWGVIENVLGGAPTYAGFALRALNKNVGIIAKIGRDLPERFPPIYKAFGLDTEGITVVGEHTTVFENVYDRFGNRKQTCKHRAPSLTPEDIPESYRDVKGFYVSPVVGEVTPDFLKALKRSDNVVMFDPQGVMRRVGRDGKIKVEVPENLGEFIRHVDIVKLGRDEMMAFGKTPKELLGELRRMGSRVAIVTLGEKGAVVAYDSKTLSVRGLRVEAQDVTGAGDVFGGAFLARYLETKSLEDSIRFANISAGLKVRYKGPTGFPTEQEILRSLGQ